MSQQRRGASARLELLQDRRHDGHIVLSWICELSERDSFKIAVPLLIFNEELVQLVPQDPRWNQIGTEPATFACLTASSVANQNRNHPSVCMFLHDFPAVVAVWKASHMQFVTSLLQFEGETHLRGASGYSGERISGEFCYKKSS